MHKKLIAVAALALAAAAASVSAFAQEPASPGSVVDWSFVKAVSVACKHNVSGLDNTMNLGLAYQNAQDHGAQLTKANYQRFLAVPRKTVLELVPGRIAALALTPEDCPAATQAMERRLDAITASFTPPRMD